MHVPRSRAAKSGRGGALMAIMALLPPGGTDQGLGGDSDEVNGSYELR